MGYTVLYLGQSIQLYDSVCVFYHFYACMNTLLCTYCKTLKFREHLIFAQIRKGVVKGGQGQYGNL